MTSNADSKESRPMSFDPETKITALDITVTNVQRELGDVKQQVNVLSTNTTNSFTILNSKIDAKFDSFSRELQSGQKTPWIAILSAMTVIFSIFGYVINLNLSPTRDDLAYIKATYVTQADIKQRSDRAAEDRNRIENNIDLTMKKEVYLAQQSAFKEYVRTQDDNLQREIDGMKEDIKALVQKQNH